MAAAVFVHVSDIHFGQERDESVHIHNDVKQQLLADAAEVVRSLPGGSAHGILVTGDIAQSGTHKEYEDAAVWLDALARAVGCEIHRIQMVPGNHDLDRTQLSTGGAHILEVIRGGGATEYERILSNDVDRAALYARFRAYGKFCEGYDCLLDEEGRFSTNMQVQIAPGRSIRFIRMNSALLCTGAENDSKPELIVGGRQFVIPRNDGEETVVLMHHPLHWLKDSDDARTYLRSRARVLITGHEHNPKVSVEAVEPGCDFMMLAAGATVPFRSNEEYTFTYNLLEFDWNEEHDALTVRIHARAWNPKLTRFESDPNRLGAEAPSFVLGSPYFRRAPKPPSAERGVEVPATPPSIEAPRVEMVAAGPERNNEGDVVPPEQEGYRLVLLRFFRDLTEGERLRILVALDAVPPESDEPMTQAVERQLFDWLVRRGQLRDIEVQVNALVTERNGGEDR